MGSYIDGLTMSQAFYRSAERFPDKVAQRFNPDLYNGDGGGEFTFSQMRERVEYLASGLLEMGLNKRERVAIISRNSPYWTHADVATINCGAVLVTIYPTLSINEISYIVNDSESRYLFVGSQDILDRILPGLNEMPTLKKIIMLDMKYTASDERIMGLGELIELGRKTWSKNREAYENRWKNLTLDDWATILYTSGTTGQGKGVILTHGSFSSRMDGTYRYFISAGHPFNDDDVVLSFLPLSHIFDRGCSQWIALWVGATICYADSPATLMTDLPKYNPTWFSCVPRLYEKIYMQFQQMLEASPMKKKLFNWALKVGAEVLEYRSDGQGHYNMSESFDVRSRLPFFLRIKYNIADRMFAKVRGLFGSRMRWAFSASAGISPDLLRFFYICGVPVVEGYGLTETTSAVCYNPINAVKIGSVGPEANGSVVRLAEDGELETAGAGLFIGYLNKPEDTKEAFTEDGWFKTGDLAVRDPDGYYRIVDRKKSIICLAIGKNVAPLKIEGLFSTSIAVEQVFLIGDERNYISALIVPNFNYFAELFERENIAYDRNQVVEQEINGAKLIVGVGDDFIAQPVLKKAIADTVAEVNRQLEEFERVKQYTIINHRFTEDRGELTPTQKTKKRVILKNYADVIEKMYQQKK